MSSSKMDQQWALITGATSGIGAAFARHLAKKGHSLILTGRRREKLESLAEELKSSWGTETKIVTGDLAEEAPVQRIIDAGRECGSLAYIINNAGFGSENGFFEEAFSRQEPMLKVHIDAAVKITHALAPLLVPPEDSISKKSGIILVSSIASFVSSPNSVLYCSTKAFLNSFAKSLAAAMFPKGIPVQALCPGFTRTDFHAKLDIPKETLKSKGIIRWMSPENVAAISLKKLRLGRIIVVPGFFNKLLVFVSKLIPQWIYLPVAARKGKLFLSKKSSE